MWYQVVNVGGMDRNYLETSGSSIMAYALLKGVRLGFLPESYRTYGEKAFHGICEKYLSEDEKGELHLDGICLVAGLGGANRRSGTFDYYMSELPPDFIDKFYNDPYHCMRAPGGESFQDVLKRTEDFYQSLVQNKAYENATIFISTHGAAGRCLLANFYDDKEDIWRGGIPKNCSVCIVEVKDGVGTVLEKDKIFYDEAE